MISSKEINKVAELAAHIAATVVGGTDVPIYIPLKSSLLAILLKREDFRNEVLQHESGKNKESTFPRRIAAITSLLRVTKTLLDKRVIVDMAFGPVLVVFIEFYLDHRYLQDANETSPPLSRFHHELYTIVKTACITLKAANCLEIPTLEAVLRLTLSEWKTREELLCIHEADSMPDLVPTHHNAA